MVDKLHGWETCSMAGSLQELLLVLNASSGESGSRSNEESAAALAGDIGKTVLQDATHKELDYCCSLLFDKDNGILTFLRKYSSPGQYEAAKVNLLEVLQAFINRAEKKILPYAVEIKATCMAIFVKDKSAKLRGSLFPILIKVIELTTGTQMGKDMDVTKMIERFFMELARPAALSMTVKRGIYVLLGVMSEVYPELMINYSDRLLGIYLNTLKVDMTSKTSKHPHASIAGCLEGLTCLLTNFTQSAQEDSKHSFNIYKYTKAAIDHTNNYTRYDVPKAGLRLLAKHAGQLDEYIIDDYEVLFLRISHWSNHSNREMAHEGFMALEAILKQISQMMVERAKKDKQEGAIFKFFIHHFREIMDNPNSSSKEVSLAIRGYGLFAAPCNMFMTSDDVKFMYNEMIQRSEQMFFSQEDIVEERLRSLPSFIESLASIVTEMKEVNSVFLASLEKLVVLLMESYPRLSFQRMGFGAIRATLKVFIALISKGIALRSFLSKVVYQGVIRTCSHPVVLEADRPSDQDPTPGEVSDEGGKKISYSDYLELWTSLISCTTIKEFGPMGVEMEERKRLAEALYDEIVVAVLKILKRLDLTSNKTSGLDDQLNTEASGSKAEQIVTSDSTQGLHATKPKDFQIFINLVDFSRDILPVKFYHYFTKWTFSFGHEIILLSTQFPLVSGFYKLLSICMTVCGKTRYFDDLEESKVKADPQDSMEVDGGERKDLVQKEACFLLFTKFVKEVLIRLKQYKDDLLAACLQLILALPKEVVSAQMVAIVPALQISLKMGLSYLPLATNCLHALESWSVQLPSDIIQPHYPAILPYLDAYLKTADKGAEEAGGLQTLSMPSTSINTRGKRKIVIKQKLDKKRQKSSSSKDSDGELATVRQKCVCLLGSLGGSNNVAMVTCSADDIAKVAVAWDTEKNLKFDVPFMDIKPSIYFDPFLPRIVELATSSSDRQTKVAACELLHSMVLYMLGRSVQQPDAKDKFPMGPLYQKIFPSLLRLACDVELVARQLFEPLVMQLIHWLTNNKKFESQETAALLDAIMDGIVDPSDTALRDFSARCIEEFLKWSIKQTSKKEQQKSPHNTKSVLLRIYSFAQHPSSFKRMGASLAFNNIYRVFREEEALVSMFTFEILANFVDSLALAHQDDKSLGTQEQCRLALTHLERIIREKSSLLSKDDDKRRKPKDWSSATLNIAVRWLLRQCGRPQTECRHVCMELVFKLAPFIKGQKTPQDYFTTFYKSEGTAYFLVRFEGGGYKVNHGAGLSMYPKMPSIESSFSLRIAFQWFDILLATLDCYTWVLGQDLLSPDQLFNSKGPKQSCVFTSMGYFLEKLMRGGIEIAAQQFTSRPEGLFFSPREVEDYNRAKCTVIIRIINFITVLLGKHHKEAMKVIPEEFWSNELWDMVLGCCLTPREMGFNMGDVEVMMKLPETMEGLLMVLSRFMPAPAKKNLQTVMAAALSKNSLLEELPENLSDTSQDLVRLSHLTAGYEELYKTGLLLPALKESGQEKKIALKFMHAVFKATKKCVADVSLSPSSLELTRKLLHLSFLMRPQVSDVMTLLLNKSPAEGAGSPTNSTAGAVFYSRFRSVINAYLVTVCDQLVPILIGQINENQALVGDIILGMLEKLAKDRTLRKQEGSRVVSVLLSKWMSFSTWWSGSSPQDLRESILIILTKLLILDAKVASQADHPAFRDVFGMYRTVLMDPKNSLVFKSRALDLLPFFTTLPEKELNELKECLDRFVADCFPMRSTEFPVGTSRYNDYITAINKILYALELSGSLMLLELVISILCRESRHVYEEEIQNSLTRFVKRLPVEKHKVAVEVAYQIFSAEDRYSKEIRRSALERVCIPLLRSVKQDALIDFFLAHVKHLVDTIQIKLKASSEAVMEGLLVSKVCCLELVEVMYSRLSIEQVHSPSSRLSKHYDPSAEDGKALTKTLTRAVDVIKKENMQGESLCLELRRQYHCAAYNCLVAIVSCTQTDVRFYQAFLFSDKVQKGEFCLDNLIDKERKYTFEVEMATPMARKKKFVSIRNDLRESRLEDGEEGSQLSPSAHYLPSQYLADSSLSAEVSQYDFSARSQAFASTLDREREKERISSIRREMDTQEGSVSVVEDYVEMEMDALNQHECMAAMTALLQHMKRNKITPPIEQGTTPSSLPPWMDYLNKKLTSNSTHRNIKLFIAKLIINTEEVFRPYAKFWFGPIVQLILCGDCGDEGIHYMVVDLVVTMLSWATVAIPEDSVVDRTMCTRLLEYLMSHAHYQTRSVLRNNLEMIKTLVECWKGRFDVPTRVIYDLFRDPDPNSLKNATGIQLLGVILANKLPPYNSAAVVDKERYFHSLAGNLSHRLKAVYAPAAEVVGMALQYMEENEKESEQFQAEFKDHVYNLLNTVQLTKMDNFITILHKMAKHYPSMADRFVNKVLFLLPSQHGEYKTHCLEILLWRIDKIEDAFLQLKAKGIMDMLKHRHEATQQVALYVVKGLLEKLTPQELVQLLPFITASRGQLSGASRAIMYDINMWIYDHYREEDSEAGNEILGMAKDSLLQGLSDDNLKNRLTVQNFWSHETRLPTGTLDRMVAMLEAMYSPSTESQYLSYATNLLLEMTSRSPDYNREIFEQPLSECKFQEYSVQSSWKQRYMAMTPMFVETQASQSPSSQSLSPDTSMQGVRATQDVQQFSATQQQDTGAGNKAPFNWLTQSSMDTYADYGSLSLASQSAASSQSALLFTVGTGPAKPARRKLKPAGPGFGQGHLKVTKDAVDGGEESSQGSEILRLKRRFLKENEQSRVFFMRRAMRQQKRREEYMKEQKVRRESQVTMYRKYRVGDLPDIQIKHSYIIAPLQALAQRDHALAKMLFSAVFQAIFKEIESVKSEREAAETIKVINTCLNNMLQDTTQYFPPFIACILDIAQHLPMKIRMDPGEVSSACITTMQQPLGIVVLEDQLIYHADDAQPRAKKQRGMPGSGINVSLDTKTWLELARLYKSIGDFDVLQGIFSGKLNTKELTKRALEAEARCDYQAARKLYQEALNCSSWPDGDPEQSEQDLWDDAVLQCYSHLTDWSSLSEWSVQAVDDTTPPDLNKIWEDAFYQERYLPFVMESKLKLVLDGDTEQQPFIDFISQALTDNNKKALLEDRYCETLSLLYLWQHDYDRARYYVNKAMENFMREWSSIDLLMAYTRNVKLQTLQKLNELQEFLEFVNQESNFEGLGPASRLVNKWMVRSPDPVLDPCHVWDDIVTNRCVYMDLIQNRIEKRRIDEEDEEEDQWSRQKILLRLAQAESASLQDNYSLSLKLLGATKPVVKAGSDGGLLLRFIHCYTGVHHRKVQFQPQNSASKITSLRSMLDTMEKHCSNRVLVEQPDLASQHNILRSTSCRLLYDCVYPEQLDQLDDNVVQALMATSNCKKRDKDEILSCLIEKGYQWALQASLKCGKEGPAKAHMALVAYCDKFLRIKEDDDDCTLSWTSESCFPDMLVRSLLKAMRLNCQEARKRFPRLLQIVEYHPKTTDTFIEEAEQVPCWMFLSWMGQMMALVDKPESRSVQNLLFRLAETYPQALIYPYKVSRESFTFTNDTLGKRSKEIVKRLDNILSAVPLVEKLVNKLVLALEQLGQIPALLDDWGNDMKRVLQKKPRNKDAVVKCYTEMYSDLMDHKGSGRGGQTASQDLYDDTQDSQVTMGNYRRRYAQQFAKDMDKDFGKDGSILASMTTEQFLKKFQLLKQKLNVTKGQRSMHPPEVLKEYCTWLSDFKASNYDKELEIPGQYKGDRKPMPEYHTKISSFDQKVKVMSSLRVPKRITIRGNDEKEYMFLVKGGEDLRQDQRIEQLFAIMNEIFVEDAACRQQNLQLRTYQVIPMTQRVGMIEWMTSTTPLKIFLESALTDNEKKFIYSEKGPRKLHMKWTDHGGKNLGEDYAQVYKKSSKTETIKAFREKESKMPWDLSRRAYLRMSRSPEAFFTLRCKFAKSHAVICVCQYLLGIGDRHLSNFMVNLETGGMIGIDFGHAFGSATQFLPVPELMPFRLTRQLTNLLMPLYHKGLLEGTMIHALHALRKNSDLLLNTMDVFIKDQSLDWKVFAEKQAKQGMGEDEGDSEWYPKQKINFARRKFQGYNPAHITRKELELGHLKRDSFKAMSQVTIGDAKDNIRAQLPKSGLTTEQQVSCLIEQATDPNLLGRVYHGWEPWV